MPRWRPNGVSPERHVKRLKMPPSNSQVVDRASALKQSMLAVVAACTLGSQAQKAQAETTQTKVVSKFKVNNEQSMAYGCCPQLNHTSVIIYGLR